MNSMSPPNFDTKLGQNPREKPVVGWDVYSSSMRSPVAQRK